MAAKITRFRSKAARLHTEQAAELRQMVLGFPGLPDDVVGALVAHIDQQTAAENGWPFVMMSPEDSDKVMDWLAANSAMPIVAMRLWMKLFRYLRWETGEITKTRDELAELVSVQPGKISVLMGELEELGAISKQRVKVAGMRGPGVVRYFMNPNIATHQTGAARDQAQAKAPKLALVK